MESINFNAQRFWEVYDLHLKDSSPTIRKELRDLVSTHPKIRELQNPERNWNTILAWEALETKTIQSENGLWRFKILCGEIVIYDANKDKDIHICRIPQEEITAESLVGNYKVYNNALVGLFLPLYEPETIFQRTKNYARLQESLTLQYVSQLLNIQSP